MTSAHRNRAAHAWLAVLGLAAVAAAVLAWTLPSATPVGARLVIVAPPIVSTALVENANALSGRPFDARADDSEERALDDVRHGRADAAVVVDLLKDADALHVSAAVGTEGRRALEQAVEEVESGLGRTLHTSTVPAQHDHRIPYVVTLATLVLGFLCAVVATWRRGTFETTLRAGVVRVAGFTAVGLVAAVACLAWPWPLQLVVLLLVVAAAITTTALEALLGLGGLAVSAMLFLLVAAPLGRFTPALMVPEPWHAITPWFLHGSGLQLASDALLDGGAGTPRAWAIVTAWIVVPILTLSVARARRPGEQPRK
ncbi:hypothetical protein [Nocardioides sp. Kera G14]|uniref:hypothetical protein n=1 Tax=Nocardioides sp. Kera G14 TaxID=2884264 RepID=UPI001D11A9D3|nr:hypothetical protein [Nocardioides sp. Kera G14]UDY24023.1 hypothetical protein LH076_01635 [Nocardioides sp. Kera G14]